MEFLLIFQVITHFPSQTVVKVSEPEVSGIVTNINNKKWKTAAKQILNHKDLAEEIKVKILDIIVSECQTLCNSGNGSMLWKSTPADLKSFSLQQFEADLRRLAPFMLSILSTITKDTLPATCAAASTALRGRDPRLSSFAYYMNSILQYGGAKKAIFQRLCKMGITTNHNHAVGKQSELANLCAGPD